jgi:phage terminase large subunit-like protein
MTLGEKVIRFIEAYCLVPEGKLVGQPMVLEEFQKQWILDTYDNPDGTLRSYLSIARKNGKSALIAAVILAHLVGPLAKQNSQIITGARSREQAAIVFKLATKMVQLNPELDRIVRLVPSTKTMFGIPMNVEFRAIAAEAGTSHGLSPVVAILDEVGQVKGPYDAFVEAIETAQGAHDEPLLIAISTQAASDGDLFSIWLDDAERSEDPTIVSHLYTAPEDAELDDESAWAAANPALNKFRSLRDMQKAAERAIRMPTAENSFRWLFLNQRIDANSPFVSKSLWKSCGSAVVDTFDGLDVYGGLDLSSVSDLTCFTPMARKESIWHCRPQFWVPEHNIRQKALDDRVPYDVWAKDGKLTLAPGKTIEYEYVANYLFDFCQRYTVKRIGFDRWGWAHLKPWLEKAGFPEEALEGEEAIFIPIGQGFQSMTPALRDFESAILNGQIAHDNHPVLAMCAANAVVQSDPAGNRKLNKDKSHGRIDGMVAQAMAFSVAGTYSDQDGEKSFWESAA